jgi:drug/metabolite transporter (DMT)-like permease
MKQMNPKTPNRMEQIIFRINRFSQKNSKAAAYIVLAIGILCLSFAPVFVREANAPGIVTSFYRMFITLILFTPITFVSRRSVVDQTRSPNHWRFIIFPIAAGVSSAIDHSLWSIAVMKTHISNATLLNSISPIWVSLIAIFFLHQKFNKRFWIGLTLVITGMIVISGILNGNLSSGSMTGNILALISSLFYAGYFSFTELGRKHYSVFDQMWISLFFCSLVLAIFMVLNGYPFTGYGAHTYRIFILTAMICQLGGYFCLTYALGNLPATIVSPSIEIQPILSSVLAVFFYSEPFGAEQIFGSIAILTGIYQIDHSKIFEKN